MQFLNAIKLVEIRAHNLQQTHAINFYQNRKVYRYIHRNEFKKYLFQLNTHTFFTIQTHDCLSTKDAYQALTSRHTFLFRPVARRFAIFLENYQLI